MARIVSLGSALQDIYLIDHDDLTATDVNGSAVFGKVLVGSKVEIDKMSFETGGGGLNSAVTFARNGHEAILMGNLAHDAAGEAILRVLDREGIDSSFIHFVSRGSTGTSVVLLDSKSGERTVMTCRGVSTRFGNLPEADLELAQPDWIYVTSLGGDLETLERFLKKAREMGVGVMLNPGMAEIRQKKKLLELMPMTDVLLVNKTEAAELVPGVLLTELIYRLGNYVETVIITDGGMGGIAVNRSVVRNGDAAEMEIYRFGIYEDRKVKDATGAGDAFGSGFLSKWADGYAFREALMFASANSTAVVSEVGANRGALEEGARLHPMPIQKL